MNETLTLFLSLVAGWVLGAIFFGGLWWTVQRGLDSQSPALWFMWSLLIRMTIVLTGFFFVMGGQWERLIPCLVTFFFARLAVSWLMQLPAQYEKGTRREVSHAP